MKVRYKVRPYMYDEDYEDWKPGDTVVFKGYMYADESDREVMMRYGVKTGDTFIVTHMSDISETRSAPHPYVVHYNEEWMGAYCCAFKRRRMI